MIVNQPLNFPRSVFLRIGLADQKLVDHRVNFELHILFTKLVSELSNFLLDDAQQNLVSQMMELHNSAESVSELGTKCLVDRIVDNAFVENPIAEADKRLSDFPRASIAGHDDDCVAEVRLPRIRHNPEVNQGVD